ncbi:tyrosine-type recombinase/integrase [Methylocystis iwaonis]|uniref:tyrosine-type recombinase/integrase n=1 Tax=Methylocystis iwaonis TaxID=2885079 RepID=UPI002E7ADFD6|nr:tyrosine-type recombinase/integrase [Methylocystis iwaonis]
MSAEEVVRFLEAVDGLRNRVALATAYAAGLRVREVTRLKVASIDSTRMLIDVEIGTGGKGRVTWCEMDPRLRSSLFGDRKDLVEDCAAAFSHVSYDFHCVSGIGPVCFFGAGVCQSVRSS